MKHTSYYFISDMVVMLQRSLHHIFRSLDTIITVTLTPVAIMLLFVYVFGGAMAATMTSAEFTTYMLPGVMLMSIAGGVAYTALRLFTDIKSGIFDRFHSMPISGFAPLWGHVLTSLVSNLLSLAVIMVVALCMGFRSSASILQWFAILGILTLFTLSLTWVAVVAGLKAKSPDGASAFSYILVYLPFLSSAFVPTESMPHALRIFAQHQPVTAIVDSIRGLFANQAVGNELWVALSWCMGILIVAFLFAMRIYRQRSCD
ncbi:ABC transporter permease [Amedibacillus sp. YH-ame10]